MMRIEALIYLVVLIIVLPGSGALPPIPMESAQETTNSCPPKISFDLGDLGTEKFSVVHNGTLNMGDLSWFKFTIVEPSKFLITILQRQRIDRDDKFAFLIYDEDMNYMASGWDPLALNLPTGTYYVRVDINWFDEGNYTLLASNLFEEEPNEGLSEATDLGTISGWSIYGASIEPTGDTDFFKFRVSEDQGGLLKIYPKSYDEEMTLVLYGFNQSQKRYLPETSGSIIKEFVAPGTYYLKVEDYGQDSSYDYGFNLSISPITCDKEPNDSFAQAKPMGALNSSAVLMEKGCIGSNDIDYFQFEVLENMSVTVKTITSGDTFICLYDSNDQSQSLDCNDDYYDRSSRIDTELPPGTYYVTVEGYGGEEGFEYELSVSL